MSNYDAWKTRAPEDEPGYYSGRYDDEPEDDECIHEDYEANILTTLPRKQPTLRDKARFTPQSCPCCGYDRRFPETASGGWIYPGNNGPYGPCPMCNPDGKHPRS